MRSFLTVSVAITLIGLTSFVRAADDIPPAIIMGGWAGDKCGTFINAAKNKEDSHYLSWLQGYISAYNVYAPWDKGVAARNIAKGTDVYEWELWITNYCTAHPFESYIQAVSAMMQYLGGLDPARNRDRWKK